MSNQFLKLIGHNKLLLGHYFKNNVGLTFCQDTINWAEKSTNTASIWRIN